MKLPCVYILASQRNGTLYVGVTSDIHRRMSQHKKGLIPGFSKRYNVTCLVYYETFGSMDAAIIREKRLKEWHRAWKIRLIQSMNPEWTDLFEDRTGALTNGPADVERGY